MLNEDEDEYEETEGILIESKMETCEVCGKEYLEEQYYRNENDKLIFVCSDKCSMEIKI